MEKVREVIAYKNYFEDFLKTQPTKVQDKIFKIIEISAWPNGYIWHILATLKRWTA